MQRDKLITKSIIMERKFTQEIKDNWLKALKSGEYKQGFAELFTRSDNSHCCIGVLGCVIGLKGGIGEDYNLDNSAYNFLEDTIGKEKLRDLYTTNDEMYYRKEGNRDYRNVIPMIELLPVTE